MAAARGTAGARGLFGGARLGPPLPRSPAALLFLNLLDGSFTLTFLQLKVAEEANPLMRLAYDHSPLAFMVLKLAVVNAGVALLWANWPSAVARGAMKAGVCLYAVIVVYHLSFLCWLLTG